MLDINNTILLIIDVQERLVKVMHDKGLLIDNLKRLIKGTGLLGIPILWTEQIPEKLGHTIPEISQLLKDQKPIVKTIFSCYSDTGFRKQFQALNKNQVLIAGIETHVCVYQTIDELLEEGYEVEVVADAVASRFARNKEIGLEKIKSIGGEITSVEMALFEIQRAAEGDHFRELVNIVK